MFFFLALFVGSSAGVPADRIKRFLNAEVHNRIDVLSKSQQEHTTWLKYMAFGAAAAVLILFLLFIVLIIIMFYRSRTHHRRPSSSTIHQTPHPMLDFHTLDNIFRSFSPTSPCSSQPYSHPNFSSIIKSNDSSFGIPPPLAASMLKF